jgi:hypothetical protein
VSKNLIVDFAVIETGVNAGAPAPMTWFAAFGLLTTLVWLDTEILYLLVRIRAVRSSPPGCWPRALLGVTIRSMRDLGRPTKE